MKLSKLASLPSDEPTPPGLTVKQKREWMLSALYRDVVLLEGELRASRVVEDVCM